jgi:hypothetical protein
MKIPKSVTIGGRTWRVIRGVKHKSWYGNCSSSRCVIELSTKNKTKEDELHTFHHELLHAIAYTMGWGKFNRDETKIDAMAGLLLQALRSMK